MKTIAKIGIIFLVLATFACSKQESTPLSIDQGILASNLVRHVPDSAAGLVVWSLDTPAYAKFANSAWAKNPSGEQATGSYSMGLVDQIIQNPGESKDLATLLNVLKKSGFLDQTKPGSDLFKEIVIFAGLGEGSQPVDAGLYARVGSEPALKELITKFKTALDQEGVKNEARTYSNSEGLVMHLAKHSEDPTQAPTEMPVYLAQHGVQVAITTTPSLGERLHQDLAPDAKPAILRSATFTEAAKTAPLTTDTICYGFVDLKQVVDRAIALDQAAGIANSDFKSDDLPVTGVVFSREMGSELRDQVFAPWNPKLSQVWSERVAKLKDQDKNPLLDKAPGETLFFLGLDGKVLNSLVEMSGETANLPPEDAKMLELAKTIKHFGLGIKNAQGPAPFPDLFLVFESTSSAQIQAELKSGLDLLAMTQGMPTDQMWKSATERGVKYDYVLTPLGVGVFLGERNNQLVLASSQSSLLDLLGDAGPNSQAKLGAGLSDKSRAVISDKPAALVSYLNFERSAAMVENLMGSLAMFTGGTETVSKQQIDYLRSLGQASSHLAFDTDGMKIKAVYEEKRPS